MQIPFSPPDITQSDIDAVVAALQSGWITSGPTGEEFRHALTEYCQSQDTLLVNSATAALETALRFLGIGPGDEVIVPAYTYTASAAVIAHVGAQIVMVDVAPGSYFPTVQEFANAITERTKAIITVDLAGVPYDATELLAYLENNKAQFRPNNPVQEQIGRIAYISDGAHSLGAQLQGVPTGNIADFTAFSFHAVKNLTTAEGGALTWRTGLPLASDEILRTTRMLTLHGQSKSALEKSKAGSWEYDIEFLGYKMNMPDITAALGLSQLKRYPQMLAHRKNSVAHYDNALLPLGYGSLSHTGSNWESSRHLYLLDRPGWTVDERNSFIVKLAEAGISANVHYKPLPLLSAYQRLGFQIANYPNAYAQYEKVLSLPLHTKLTERELVYITDTISALTPSV